MARGAPIPNSKTTLPIAARPAAIRLRGFCRQGDIRRGSDHSRLEEGPGVSRRQRPIVGIGSRAELRDVLAPPEPRDQPRPAGFVQHCRSFVSRRTLIGGPAHQTRNGSDLCELLVIASNLAGAFRLPSAFRRLKRRRRGYYQGPPKTCWARKAACHGSNLIIRTLGYSYNAYVLIFD